MTSTPTFSVVMPAHDTASTVRDAVASVLAQTRSDLEVLVVDDASTDDTVEAVQSFTTDPRVRLIRRATSGGPGAARNDGFATARGTFVSMLDSDDLWLPRYLETVGTALAAHPASALACTGHWTLEEPPGLIRREPTSIGDLALDPEEFLLRLAQRNFVVNSTVTVRRHALQACGGCDASLAAAVDLDLWLRLAAAGHGAICIGRPLAVYRLRHGSIQHDPRNELRALRSVRTVYSKVADDDRIASAARLLARDQLERLDRRIARLARPDPVARTGHRARRLLGAARDHALQRRIWYPTTPVELTTALPSVPSGQRPLR